MSRSPTAEELWTLADALEAVARCLGTTVEALVEDPSLAIRDRDEARSALAKVAEIATDMHGEVEARRAELSRPTGGQSCGPRGGPLCGASPGVLSGVTWWARAIDKAIRAVPPLLRTGGADE